ncbi:CotH protein [Papillibacter cinnamivorans DSM 12816]|uniref:CotH protein n=2 Tax=Papillibacter TaxID=100175 RepID=A0A1W2BAY7_9FIRM|nr:CotH protein [Papillibacter cinnamivorans DSM 12816]
MKRRVLSFLTAIAVLAGLAGCSSGSSGGQATAAASGEGDYETEIFGKDVITVNITASQEDWDSLMENAVSKPYISADVEINGVTFKDVGIKTKGNTTLTQVAASGSDRFSLKLNFDKYAEGQNCYGLDTLDLNNIYGDSTYLKEYMSYALLNYMEVPSSLCTFADISVNGEHYGLFLAVEDVDESFLERNYGENYTGKAYKPESLDMDDNAQGAAQAADGEDVTAAVTPAAAEQPAAPSGNAVPQPSGDGAVMPSDMPRTSDNANGGGPGMSGGAPGGNGQNFGGGGTSSMDGGALGVNLVYTDDELSSYSNIFDNAITDVTEEDENQLIASLKGIGEGEDLEKYINVDEVLRYAATNVFLVNLDSYLSNMGHNYCLYEDNGQLSMIPWDYNLSFGTYNSSGASDAVNYAVDTVFSGVTADERPIIGKLLENDEYLAKYHEYLSQLAEYVTSGKFAEKVDAVSEVIDSYVKDDDTSFEGYDAYTAGVEELKTFASLRAQSVAGQLDGSIPSTLEAQSGSEALVDASGLDMSALGTIGNTGGGQAGNGGFGGGGGIAPSGGNQTPPSGGAPGGNQGSESLSQQGAASS